MSSMERIAKIIRDCGICSRREAEEYIRSGRIGVNNVTILEPGTLASIDKDRITVDGKLISKKLEPRLWIFYKPSCIMTTKKDPQNRETIYNLLPSKMQNLMYVGRLDYNSEGLLLLTNCSKIKYNLERPENEYLRIYKARGFGSFNEKDVVNLKGKITIDDFDYQISYVKLLNRGSSNHWFEIGIKEGKNREVRKIFEHFGVLINKLVRTNYGQFSLDNLNPGEFVELTYNSFESIISN
jgi:23S rRNA pseudouridine2605 synthase